MSLSKGTMGHFSVFSVFFFPFVFSLLSSFSFIVLLCSFFFSFFFTVAGAGHWSSPAIGEGCSHRLASFVAGEVGLAQTIATSRPRPSPFRQPISHVGAHSATPLNPQTLSLFKSSSPFAVTLSFGPKIDARSSSYGGNPRPCQIKPPQASFQTLDADIRFLAQDAPLRGVDRCLRILVIVEAQLRRHMRILGIRWQSSEASQI